jgi:hypothetical protein
MTASSEACDQVDYTDIHAVVASASCVVANRFPDSWKKPVRCKIAVHVASADDASMNTITMRVLEVQHFRICGISGNHNALACTQGDWRLTLHNTQGTVATVPEHARQDQNASRHR